MIFQITGYPRSGTAWLTTMFNLAPEVMAYHELAMYDRDWKNFLFNRSAMGKMVGDIGTYQYFPNAIIAKSKKVFIDSDPIKSRNSVVKATGIPICSEVAHKWSEMANNWISEWGPAIFEYRELFKLETLEELWNYCLEDRHVEFPKKKVEQLLKFNIQIHEPKKPLSNPGAIERLAELL